VGNCRGGPDSKKIYIRENIYKRKRGRIYKGRSPQYSYKLSSQLIRGALRCSFCKKEGKDPF
jgi:hypothetical protein